MSYRRTRRTFLTDFGRTSVGLVVLGGGLAACAQTGDPVVDQPTSGPSTPGTATGSSNSGVATVDLGFVAAYVIMRAGEAALIDTGTSDSEDAIEEVLQGLGLGWGDVGHVILTHSHGDHVGSLRAVAEAAPEAALYGGEADLARMSAPREIMAVGDGDTVFDLQIINTPGHTPGHISVFDAQASQLFTGDALTGDDGSVAGPNPEFTPDMDSGRESVRKLALLEPRAISVFHGFPVASGAADLTALAESL
ncbi:MAG: MBL fold metallo-hydrolase [Euzebya sp.]